METPLRALMTGPGRGAASTHWAWPRVSSSVEDRNPVKVLLVEPPVTRYTYADMYRTIIDSSRYLLVLTKLRSAST